MQKLLLYFFLVFGLNISNVHAQCSISDITTEVIECDENNEFSLLLNFNFNDVSADGFRVVGNGVNYGSFSYDDLPVTLDGLNGNCIMEHELIIRDLINPACTNFTSIDPVCCRVDCNIDIVNLEVGACSEGQFASVSFDLDYEGVLNPNGVTNGNARVENCSESDSTYSVLINFDHEMSADSFIVGGPGLVATCYAYTDLPVSIDSIPFDDEERDLLVVDKASSLCFNGIALGVVNDCNNECNISNLLAEVYNCEDGTYSIDFEFDGKQLLNGDTLAVNINEVPVGLITYGAVFYTIENIALDCGQMMNLVLTSNSDVPCTASYSTADYECCECPETNFVAEAFCLEGPSLEYEFTTSIDTGSYTIIIGGMIFGPFDISVQESIDLDGFTSGEYEVRLIINEDEMCTETQIVILECPIPDCAITDVFYEFPDDCAPDSIFLDLEVSAIATSAFFEIILNGSSLGTYSYDSTFITLGPLSLDCEVVNMLIIVDLEDSNCTESVVLADVPCCDSPCSWPGVEISYECISEFFAEITLNLDDQGEGLSDSFSLNLLDEFIGVFAYTDSPISFQALASGEINFLMIDQENEDCGNVVVADINCQSDCELGQLEWDITFCVEGIFNILIDTEHEGTADSFDIRGNGVFYGTFAYADLPINLEGLTANSGLAYEFIVIDNENDDCQTTAEVGEVNCPTSTEQAYLENIKVTLDNGSLHLSNISETTQMKLYDMHGRVIFNQPAKSALTIDTELYSSGIYLLNLGSLLVSLCCPLTRARAIAGARSASLNGFTK